MTRTCEVCGDELPDPFNEGAYITIETVDITVRIGQPDRPHNNEVIRETYVCGRDCADGYISENRHRETRHYTRTVDFRDDDTTDL